MIVKPFSPGNAFVAGDVAKEKLTLNKGDDRILHQR
jgi:hypothetical protein